MKIIYENNEVKQSCQNKLLYLNTETVLKYFNLILGKKIRVFEYLNDERQTRTMKVENLRDGSIKMVTIKYDDRDYLHSPMGVSHLVTINEEAPNSQFVFGKTFEVGSHLCRELCNNYYNQDTGLLIEEFNHIFTMKKKNKRYILKMKDKICEFNLINVEDDIIFKLLKIKSLEVKDIYGSLRDLNLQYVRNISISFKDCKNEETESLRVSENQLTNYEKKYKKEGNLITIVYQDGKIYVTTTQELLEEDVIKTKELDITDDIKRVKTLLTNNEQANFIRKMSTAEETQWLTIVKGRQTEQTMPSGNKKMTDTINQAKKNKRKVLTLKKK